MEMLEKLCRRRRRRCHLDSINNCNYDNDDDDDDLDRVMEWLSDGWKESKPKMRRNPSIDAIVKNVLPFLGGRGKVSSSTFSKT